MSKVFFCYRRDDTAGAVNSVYQALSNKLGAGRCFYDLTSVAVGQDFVSKIKSAMRETEVMLWFVGPEWKLKRTDSGSFGEDDHVRMELQTAVSLQIHVVPILVGGSKHMPRESDLPKSLSSLHHANASFLRPESYTHDQARIVEYVLELLNPAPAPPPSPPAPPVPTSNGTISPNRGHMSVDELQAEVDRLESLPTLTLDQFASYRTYELEYENELLAQAQWAAAQLDFEGYATFLREVAQLNQTMVEICDRELQAAPSETYRLDLMRWQRMAAGLSAIVEADIAATRAEQQRLGGDLEAALGSCIEARDLFEDLADTDLPHAEVASIRAIMSALKIQELDAMIDMNQSQYQSATNTLREANILLREIIADLERIEQSGSPDEEKVSLEVLGGLHDDAVRIEMLWHTAHFYRAFHAGNHADAVPHAEQVIQALQGANEVAGERDAFAHLRHMDLEVMQAWLSFAKAELALDRSDWDEARQLLADARNYWEEGISAGIRSGVPQGRAVQGQTGVFEILLRSAARRFDREHQGRPSPSTHTTASMTMSRTTTNSELAPQASVLRTQTEPVPPQTVTDSSEGSDISSVETASQDDRLARELDRLQRLLATAARSPSELQTAESVAAAASAASRNDSSGLIASLIGIDAWALLVSEHVGLELVNAVLRKHGANGVAK